MKPPANVLSATTNNSSSTGSQMRLQIGEETITPKKEITVTLSNLSSNTVYFEDHHSNCTIFILERFIDSVWQQVNPCAVQTAVVTFPLDAKTSTSVALDPSPNDWIPGKYRVSLPLNSVDGKNVGTSFTSEFQVQ